MCKTIFLSRLAFEMLLSAVSSNDIVVVSGNVLPKATQEDIFLELNSMAKNGIVSADIGNSKIVINEEYRAIVCAVASSKRAAVFRAFSGSSGTQCIYYDKSYVIVELPHCRPNMVKVTYCSRDEFAQCLESSGALPDIGELAEYCSQNISEHEKKNDEKPLLDTLVSFEDFEKAYSNAVAHINLTMCNSLNPEIKIVVSKDNGNYTMHMSKPDAVAQSTAYSLKGLCEIVREYLEES